MNNQIGGDADASPLIRTVVRQSKSNIGALGSPNTQINLGGWFRRKTNSLRMNV